jgi:hypothetical protein
MRSAVAVLLLALPAFADDPPKAKLDSPLDTAWKDLLSPDEAVATRAALTLATQPEAVKFLTDKLRPVKVDKKLLAKLFADLGDRDFRTREAAQAELEYFGRFIKSEMDAEAKATEVAEVKERLGKLLGGIEAREKIEQLKDGKEEKAEQPPPGNLGRRGGSVSIVNGRVFINGKEVDPNAKPVVIERPGPPAGWVRAGRGIGVLEHLATPDAVKLLEQIALGEDNAPPTKQAQDALARLKRKK